MRIHLLKLGTVKQEATGEPRLGCLRSLGSQRKGASGTGSGDQSETSCQPPIALEFSRHVPVKKEVGEEGGNPVACSPEGERVLWPLAEGFSPLSCRRES